MTNLTRYRGDTTPIKKRAISKDTGGVLDITGYNFKLTVDSLENPPDNSTKIFDVDGVVVEAISGLFDIPFDALDADTNPGDYFYDLQATSDLGIIETIDKGTFTFLQDITK